MTDRSPGVAIIGCGLVGQKRARALGPARLAACADIILDRAHAVAEWAVTLDETTERRKRDILVTREWRDTLARPDVEVVIVATTNNLLAEITLAAVQAGKHVLVEKPAARCAAELRPIVEAVTRSGGQVRVGFNHRYHRALRKAWELHAAGALGPLMFVRGRYGHGGRPGYEREWRADPVLSGGGELVDQGVHLIDLARWFLGDFTQIMGCAHTYFWQMPVDDNAFLILRTRQNQTAFLHASCTEWRNQFSFEVYGKSGALRIEGLGGSYGLERLTYHKMLPEMGPPETTIWEYPMRDDSWEVEFAEFLDDIRLGRQPAIGLDDAYAALRVVEEVYQQS